jgi:hypothetical protein
MEDYMEDTLAIELDCVRGREDRLRLTTHKRHPDGSMYCCSTFISPEVWREIETHISAHKKREEKIREEINEQQNRV